MVSQTTLVILFGYAAVFWSLDAALPVPEAGKFQISRSSATLPSLPRLAAGALLPAVLATFGLTSLLLFAHVRALGGAHHAAATTGAAAAWRRRFVERLANTTLAAAAAAALLAGAVFRLRAHGGDEVGWL